MRERLFEIEVGDDVHYLRGLMEGAPSGEGEVTCIDDVCGTLVAWIKGCSGCIAITHVERTVRYEDKPDVELILVPR